MVAQKTHPNPLNLQMQSVSRLSSIPIIESGIRQAETAYNKIKLNNRLFNWYFETAENTIFAAIESVQPAMKLFELPLKRVDSVLCKSLDAIEQRAPMFYLPPEMMIWNTKEYMSDHIMKPVLKRADSVKQIGNAALNSTLTTYAADRIDGAICVADKYVDKYLTVQNGDDVDHVNPEQVEDEEKVSETERTGTPAMKTLSHGKRFSRKLKRRLTQRTLIEARALKKQSKVAMNVLIYALELIVTDPKKAFEKGNELWEYLSKDEPENQARPQTLEQLIVLLTRESARRVVHLVNFTSNAASNLPRNVVHSTQEILHQLIDISKRLAKLTKLDVVQLKTAEEASKALERGHALYNFVHLKAQSLSLVRNLKILVLCF
ncbi:PLIN2.2 family protein [Megaselia abdita]